MPGRMGGNTTVQNLEVVQVDTDNVILVKVTYLDLKRLVEITTSIKKVINNKKRKEEKHNGNYDV